MPRRRDDLTLKDIVIIFRRLPFWVGPLMMTAVFAGMSWALPYFLAGNIDAAKEGPINIVGPVLFNGIGRASQFTAPYAAALVGILWGCAELAKWSDRRHGTGPLCPACNSPMTMRTAKKGENPGSRFWGCSRFPACSATRQL